MLLLALGPQTLGWLLIAHGVVRLRAFSVSLLLTVQPVLTTIWGILAFGEGMRALQAVGVALVLGGRARRTALAAASHRPPPRLGVHLAATETGLRMRPARIERATSASAGLRSIP